MIKLGELIKEYCPNGVEYKELLNVLSQPITDGPHETPVLQDAGIPFISVEAIHDGGIDVKKCRGYISLEYSNQCRKKYKPQIGDVYMIKSASIGRVAIVENNIDFDIWSPIAAMRPNNEVILSRFLFYVLQTNKIQKEVIKKSSKGSQPNLSMRKLEKFSIPVPPLSVQREIVRILDNFTELTAELIAELTAELTARKKQYEYYRDELLKLEDAPHLKIADIAIDIYRGSGIKRDEVTEEGIPCVRYGEIYTSYNVSFTECKSHTKIDVVKTPKFFEHGDIIFAITGENIEEIAKSIAYLGNNKCLAGGDTVVLKHNLEPRYLSYALSTTEAQKQKSAGKVKSKVVHSSVPALMEIVVPVPSIEEQKRIADLLDDFYYLINDISARLTAEIEVRQKQYEYYRDKLLSFDTISEELPGDVEATQKQYEYYKEQQYTYKSTS